MASIKSALLIRHIDKDAQIAHCLMQLLGGAFLGSLNIFVSSDGTSIHAGDNRSPSIEQVLTNAAIVFALITEKAEERCWICTKPVKQIP